MAPVTDISADDLKVFLQEAEGLLELLDRSVIQLEQESSDAELLQEIFRAAHTLKGSSGMIGFEEMAELTHAMEGLLDRVRKGTLAVTAELVDALLISLDGLKVLKNDLADGDESTLEIAPIVAALEAAAGEAVGEAETARTVITLDRLALDDPAVAARLEAASAAGLPVLRVSVEIDRESEWAAVRCFQVLNELGGEDGGEGEVIASVPTQEAIEQEQAGYSMRALLATHRSAADLQPHIEAVADVTSVTIDVWDGPADAPEQPAVEAPVAPPPPPAIADGAARIEALSQSIRVDVDVLDDLMNLVGELVIDRTRVGQVTRVLSSRYREDGEVRALGETSGHIGRVVDELHERMMQVRMLPVGVLFSKFPRLVRDLARSSGKSVTLAVDGEDTEIDRSVIEEIKDPLVHLIRNALDHGIEAPDERAAAGKTETAVLRLSARHAQGQIVITLQDDGRGIDVDAVRASAVRKGLISAEAAERLSESEAVELIFAPGLSTAQQTTEVSGRGVGMDIVRRNIEELNGRADVATRPGEGTTFTLHLPLTLATFRGLLVESAGTPYAIPLSYVQETVHVDREALWSVSSQGVVNLRGSVMSVMPLSDLLDHNGAPPRAAHGEGDSFVVVVRAGDSANDRPVAISVDTLIDQQEVVVKSLSGFLGKARGIAGASIPGRRAGGADPGHPDSDQGRSAAAELP